MRTCVESLEFLTSRVGVKCYREASDTRRRMTRGSLKESGREMTTVPAYVSGSWCVRAILGANTPTQRGGSKSPRHETSPSLPSSRRCHAHLVTPVIVGGELDRSRDPLRTSGQCDDVIGGVSYDDGVDLRQAPLLGVFDVTTGAPRSLVFSDRQPPKGVEETPKM